MMSASGTAAARLPSTAWVLFLAAAAIALAASAWIAHAHGSYGDFSDPYEYLVFADYYRGALVGHYEQWLTWYYRQSRYPPLYPLLLALAGGGTTAVERSVVVTQAMVLLGTLAVGCYVARAFSDARQGAWLLLAVVLVPGLFLLYQDPVSEPLFVALFYGGL